MADDPEFRERYRALKRKDTRACEQREKDLAPRPCCECHQKFKPMRSNQRFCSRRCDRAAYRRKPSEMARRREYMRKRYLTTRGIDREAL